MLIKKWKIPILALLLCGFQCAVDKKNAPGITGFCEALAANDVNAALISLNGSLATMKPAEAMANNCQPVIDWLKQHPCVVSAAASPGELDSDPPLKEIFLTLRTGDIQTKRQMTLQLALEKIRVISIQ